MKHPIIPMNLPLHHSQTSRRRRIVAIVAAAVLLASLLAPSVSAQTLMLKFGFEDAGTTTTDSVASVSLTLTNSSGVVSDLHGAAGTGVSGLGKALDLTSSAANGTGCIAATLNDAGLGFGVVSSWTVTEWVKPNGSAPNLARFFILGANGVTDTTAGANSMGAQVANTTTGLQAYMNGVQRNTITALSPPLPLNTWTFIAVTYDGTSYLVYSGSEGSPVTLISSNNIGALTVNFGAAGSLFLGNRPANGRAFKGYLDDMRFYTGAGNAAFLEAVRQSALPDPNVSATTITPTNSPIYAGTPVTLSATYGGTAPFTSFVWQSDGGTSGASWTNLPGSTTNTYALNSAGMTASTNQFRLIVTGAAGSATNTPASKIFVAASSPIIVANTTVTPSAVAVGGTVTASATFAGTQPIAYQWLFISNSVTTAIPGATSNVLTLTNVQFANAGSYSLVASNNPGGVPSVLTNTPAALAVTPLVQAILAVLGTNAPVAGVDDIAQLSTNGNTKFPDGLNYYDNNNGTTVGLSGQTFTTSNNPSGYALNGLYLKYGGIEGNHAAGLVETLRFYSMSGSVATLLATCQNTNPAPAIANGDWTQWSGLTNIVLQPNTTYAYTLFVSQSGGNSFEQMGNASNSPSYYAGGEIVLIPAVGGTVTFGASHVYDATFLVNLLPLNTGGVNMTPTNLTFVVSGGSLNLSWPPDHLGWILQTQTNSRSVGLTLPANTWFDVPGSGALTNTSITLDKTSPTVFFRLRSP